MSDAGSADETRLYQRAGRLFDAALEHGPGSAAREELLARAERDDPAAARLARRMLAQDDGGASPLEPAPLAGASEDDPAGVLGARLGPWVVERLLGRGGMGAVYLGRRAEPDEEVAIKLITLHGAPAAAIARFEAEARLLAALDHPNVVRYRDSGVDRLGRPYLVMDRVDGEPLSHATPEIAASVERTVAVMVTVAEAVHHLHQRRVLHRDLKPSNLLVRREGHALVPVLIDLGIARTLAEPGAEGAAQPLASGTLGLGPVGTPAFMSPEQSRGDATDVRTDVHALGAVLYALLTGHPPRGLDEHDDPVALHQRLRASDARPPSQRVDPALFGAERARRRARRIDRDLDAIVLTALASRAEERYGSAEAFAADLLRWQGRLPVSARRVGSLGRLARLVRRRPLETALVAASVVLFVGTSVLTAVSRAGEVRARRRYQEQLEVTETVNRFLTEEVFARALPERGGPDTPVIEVLRGAARGVDDWLSERPAQTVALRGSLLGVFERLGATEEADRERELALPFVEALAEDHPQRLRFEFQLATAAARRSRYDEAAERARALLERYALVPHPPRAEVAMTENVLGVALLSLNQLDEAEAPLRRAIAGLDADDPLRIESRSNLAVLLWTRGEREAAGALLEELLREVEARFGPMHSHVAGICSNLASLWLDRREPERALPWARRALAVADEVYGPDHADRLSVMNQLASCLSFGGRHDEAIALRRTVAERREELLGPENAAVGEALVNLASTLVRAGRTEEAAEPAWRALEVLSATLGPQNPSTAAACLAVAAVEDARGRRADARALAEQAIAIFQSAEGDHAVELAEARAWLEAR